MILQLGIKLFFGGNAVKIPYSALVFLLFFFVQPQLYAQEKKTYTWFINRPSNALSSSSSLKSLTVEDILNGGQYLTKTNQELQSGLLVDGEIQPWFFRWARIEDRKLSDATNSKVDHKYTAIVRPRATLDKLPDQITNPNRIKFDYWDYIDKFVFWGGSSQHGTILAPDPQWIEEAHSKGVKIYGTVFLPDPNHGGNFQDCRDLGTTSLLTKLIELADGLKFDGWFLNIESFQGADQRQACVSQIDNALNAVNTLRQDKKIDFIKYNPSPDYSGWLSNNDINFNGFIEPRTNAEQEIEYFISEYGAVYDNDYVNPGRFKPEKKFLMYPNASYWGQLEQETKFTIKTGAKDNAELVAKQYWEGMLGNNERKDSEQYNWNGVSQYTKKRLSDIPVDRYPVLAYQDMTFLGDVAKLSYGITNADSDNELNEISSIKVGSLTYARLCKSKGYSTCLTVWGTELDFIGESMNDSVIHIDVGPLEFYPEDVVLYQDQYFQGEKLVVSQANGFYDLTVLGGTNFDRSVTSLIVPPGKKVLLCNTKTEDSCQFQYTGTVKKVDEKDNDVTRAIKIVDQPFPVLATVFANANHQRPSVDLIKTNHTYNASDLGTVSTMSSSLQIGHNYQVQACLLPDLAGVCNTFYADSSYFGESKNDQYRSFMVEESRPSLLGIAYVDHNFEGVQYPLVLGENGPFEEGITSIKLLKPDYEFNYCADSYDCIDYKNTPSARIGSNYDDNNTLKINIRAKE